MKHWAAFPSLSVTSVNQVSHLQELCECTAECLCVHTVWFIPGLHLILYLWFCLLDFVSSTVCILISILIYRTNFFSAVQNRTGFWAGFCIPWKINGINTTQTILKMNLCAHRDSLFRDPTSAAEPGLTYLLQEMQFTYKDIKWTDLQSRF